MIRIGHASIGEDGARNQQAGDQTGKEVCVRSWYSKPWDFVLRCKDQSIAQKAAAACEAGCANPNIGYDMSQRNTAYTAAKKVGYDLSKIKSACETDCSAFVTLCYIAAGATALEYTANAPTTATMKSVFPATGLFTVLTAKKYLESDKYLQRGDILVKAGSHTVMALDNGDGVAAADQAQKVQQTTVVSSPAASFSKSFAATYVTTGNLNIRKGAGTKYPIIMVAPQGTVCQCYGYYSTVAGKRWLYVQIGKVVGFASESFLAVKR